MWINVIRVGVPPPSAGTPRCFSTIWRKNVTRRIHALLLGSSRTHHKSHHHIVVAQFATKESRHRRQDFVQMRRGRLIFHHAHHTLSVCQLRSNHFQATGIGQLHRGEFVGKAHPLVFQRFHVEWLVARHCCRLSAGRFRRSSGQFRAVGRLWSSSERNGLEFRRRQLLMNRARRGCLSRRCRSRRRRRGHCRVYCRGIR